MQEDANNPNSPSKTVNLPPLSWENWLSLKLLNVEGFLSYRQITEYDFLQQ